MFHYAISFLYEIGLHCPFQIILEMFWTLIHSFGTQPATDMLEIWLVTIQVKTPVLYFVLFSWASAGPSLPFWSILGILSAVLLGDLEEAAVSTSNNTGELGTQLWWCSRMSTVLKRLWREGVARWGIIRAGQWIKLS